MPHEPDLLELAAAWRSEGRQVALTTVVATWGQFLSSELQCEVHIPLPYGHDE